LVLLVLHFHFNVCSLLPDLTAILLFMALNSL